MVDTYDDYLGTAPIVVDNGSGFLKAGMAGEEVPQLNFPTILGRPKHKKVLPSSVESNLYVGPGENIRGLLKISYPINHGIVDDWMDMKAIWRHVYTELKAVSKEHAILLSEPCNNPKSNRTKLANCR